MALRKIVKIGDNKLRKICKPVEKFDRRLKILLEDMADTMYDANGVGLAAPQVGILRRAVVIDVGDGLVELVNPVIVESDGQQSGPEGCLSIPGRSGVVTRPNHVKVRAQDPDGNAIELEAEEFFAGPCVMSWIIWTAFSMWTRWIAKFWRATRNTSRWTETKRRTGNESCFYGNAGVFRSYFARAGRKRLRGGRGLYPAG